MTVVVVQVLPYFVAICAPLLVARQLNRSRRKDKQQDWDRQDLVALKAEEAAAAARAVADQAAKAADLLVVSQAEIARVAAAAQASTDAKLTELREVADVTHSLVNSNYTASLQNELAGLRREMVLLAAAPNSTEKADAVAKAEARIADLMKLLAERDEQQRAADERAALAQAVAAPDGSAVALTEAADDLKGAAADLKGVRENVAVATDDLKGAAADLKDVHKTEGL